MLRYYGIVREASIVIAEAMDGTADALRASSVEQEPAFTDRMLGRVEQAVNGLRTRGIIWRAKTLTDRGQKSQESKYGADFAGVLEIDLPDHKVKKGFLAQAKLLEPGDSLSSSEFNRLRKQCADMLSHSPDSFAFVYSRNGIRIIPAIAVLASDSGDLHAHYGRSAQRFYEEHLTCYIGDPNINAPTAAMLRSLPENIPASRLLAIRAGLE